MRDAGIARIVRAAAAGLCLGLILSAGLPGCGRQPDRPNIVLVVLDTVREDHTGPGGGRKGLTPALDRLAAGATVFHDAWATAPWTPPSHASMFTGLLSSTHGCNHQHLRLDESRQTLAEIMAAAGYETAAFFSNPWLSDRTTGLLRGFAIKRESPTAGGRPGDPGRYRGDQGGRASSFFFADWLGRRSGDAPFFAFVNFLEAHHPYDPPPAFRRERLAMLPEGDLVTSEWVMEFQAGLHPPGSVDWDRVRGLYGGDVNSADLLLADLVAALVRAGLFESTVLIVTSDHGEHMGEHGLIAHQFSVGEPLLAVPLVIRAPGRLPPGDRHDPVMLTDLFATILDLAGISPLPARRHSASLLAEPPSGPRPLIAEYYRPNDTLLGSLGRLNPELDIAPLERSFRTIRLGDVRLTLASDGTATLHDLVADPGQNHDLAAERPRDLAALQALLGQSLQVSRVGDEEVQIDEETREQLRSLGYVH